jgi:hypothetical protein
MDLRQVPEMIDPISKSPEIKLSIRIRYNDTEIEIQINRQT